MIKYFQRSIKEEFFLVPFSFSFSHFLKSIFKGNNSGDKKRGERCSFPKKKKFLDFLDTRRKWDFEREHAIQRVERAVIN